MSDHAAMTDRPATDHRPAGHTTADPYQPGDLILPSIKSTVPAPAGMMARICTDKGVTFERPLALALVDDLAKPDEDLFMVPIDQDGFPYTWRAGYAGMADLNPPPVPWRVSPPIPDHERHKRLRSLTGTLFAAGIDAVLVWRLVHAANVAECLNPLSREVVDSIVNTIAGREADRRGGAAANGR